MKLSSLDRLNCCSVERVAACLEDDSLPCTLYEELVVACNVGIHTMSMISQLTKCGRLLNGWDKP
jgi:hypothetical protein